MVPKDSILPHRTTERFAGIRGVTLSQVNPLRKIMALQHLVAHLKDTLAPGARILTDTTDEEFKQASLRWSDVNTEVPGAIIKVSSEFDVVATASPFITYL